MDAGNDGRLSLLQFFAFPTFHVGQKRRSESPISSSARLAEKQGEHIVTHRAENDAGHDQAITRAGECIAELARSHIAVHSVILSNVVPVKYSPSTSEIGGRPCRSLPLMEQLTASGVAGITCKTARRRGAICISLDSAGACSSVFLS
jgi:hypothetical protein